MKRRNFIKTTAIGAAGLSMYHLYALDPRTDRFVNNRYCKQPGAEIPVIAEVDILVAGATLGGVAAASAAAEAGSEVFLVGYLPYLGEDICGTYRYLFDKQNVVDSYAFAEQTGGGGDYPGKLAARLFPGRDNISPMHIKTVLEKELIDRNVNFLYSSYVVDIVFGDDDKPAGVIINNRTGRQAVLCRSIIDCTQGAYAARLAGASFIKPDDAAGIPCKFITIGNSAETMERNGSEELTLPASVNDKSYRVIEHSGSVPRKGFSFISLANAEQDIRDRTWDADQVDSADNMFWTAPYILKSKGSTAGLPAGLRDIPLQAFMPEGMDNVFVLGSCAGVDEQTALELTLPHHQLYLGHKVGLGASGAARSQSKPLTYATRALNGTEYLQGETGEISETLRPNLGNKKVWADETALPVLGEYDVVIAGGGTAGAPAAISAARNGVKTLVMEYLHGLGGTGTLGLIGRYWYGHRDGFTSEIDRGVRGMADPSHPRQKSGDHEWVVDWKMEWYRREIRKAGGEIWFGVIAAGAFVENGKVKGVLIATPEGRGVVLAGQVIDSTGSADIAIAAGAEYEYVGKSTVAVQGSGLPKVDPGDHYNNTDWTFVDDSDVFDVTRVFISGKKKFPGAWDLGKLPQTRERRRVLAEFMVSPIDMLNGRRYPDTISYHVSNFDTHGYTVHPYFIIRQPDGGHVTYDVDLPLRSLLPRGLDGIIVTGLGAGAHRDAMPVIRMQPCLQNQGYAVGLLAARIIRENVTARSIDLRDIQRHLAEIGNLPGRVVTDDDNMPLPDEAFTGAIAKIGNDFEMLEVLFTDLDRGVELLKEAVINSDDHNIRLNCAIALGVLGTDTGWRLLTEALAAEEEWDEGWNFTGMHQFGHSLSRLDIITIALGRCRRDETMPSIMRMAGMLKPSHYFSHFRAVSVAFETLGNSKAAPLLFDLLGMEGMTGHHVVTRTDAVRATVPSTEDVTLRNNVLKELHLARALYRCGDHYGLGRQILENYSNDLHGHYFRHAAGILGLAPGFE